jgi:hypothetical protein
MKTTVVIGVILQFFLLAAFAAEEQPYLGHWSNGRGETLVITGSTIQFADNKPVSYRDVTHATNGEDFELLITAAGKVNAFPGKTLGLHCESDSIEMTGYASHADYMEEKEPQSRVTWFKDEE